MGAARVLGHISANLREHRGAVALLLLLGIVSITHDTFADGPPRLYFTQLAKQALFMVALYVASYWLRRRHAILSRLAVAATLSIAVVLVLQHSFRLLHPARWGIVYAELADDLSGPVIAEGWWRV